LNNTLLTILWIWRWLCSCCFGCLCSCITRRWCRVTSSCNIKKCWL